MIVVVIHATIKISASSFILRLLLVKVIKDGQCVLPIRKFLSVYPTINAGCVDSALLAYSSDEGHRRRRFVVMLAEEFDY